MHRLEDSSRLAHSTLARSRLATSRLSQSAVGRQRLEQSQAQPLNNDEFPRYFEDAVRLLRDENYEKAHVKATLLTTTADSNRLDPVRSHKAWVLRWLILVALHRPSDEASDCCLRHNPDISASKDMMREILGFSSIDGVERWISRFIDSMPSEVIAEAGIVFYTMQLYSLCITALTLIEPMDKMHDEYMLYAQCDSYLCAGQLGDAIAFFEDYLAGSIELDKDAAFANLGIEIFKDAQMYERALQIADKMTVLATITTSARRTLLFQRALICIKLHDKDAVLSSLDSMKVQNEDHDYHDIVLLRARVSPPAEALLMFDKLIHTLGIQSGTKSSSGRSSLGHPSTSITALPTPASTPERDVNGLEFKIRLAKLRVQLKTAASANELDALLKACADLEWACHPKVSFIWACACVKRAWFCVPDRSTAKTLPRPSSFLPVSRPTPPKRLIDRVQALNASGSSLFKSTGAHSGNGTPRLSGSGRPSSSVTASFAQHAAPCTSSSTLSSVAPSSTAASASNLNLGSVSHESTAPSSQAAPPASPTHHRTRGRRNSNGAAAQTDLEKYLALARIHFAHARERVAHPAGLVSQYHKVVALQLHAPTEEYALELKEEAQAFMDECNVSGGTYYPKVAVLLSSMLRKVGHWKDALELLEQSKNTPPVRIERLLCAAAESRVNNLGDNDGLTRESSQRLLEAMATTSISAATSSAPSESTASFASNSAYSTSSTSSTRSERGQSLHQMTINRIIDELSQIKGRYWDVAQFHAGRLYEDELGQLAQAEMRYRQVISKHPLHMQSLYRLAFLRCRRAHPEAIATCTVILNEYPADLKVLEWRAGAYVLLCKYVEAIRDYDRILNIDRNIVRVQRARESAATLLTNTGYYTTIVSESAQGYGQALKTLVKSYWYGGQE